MERIINVKEPIKIRAKQLKSGSYSLYLDINYNGKREYQFLKLYIIPEHSMNDRKQNAETVKLANAIKSQRIIELQNEAYGFKRRQSLRLTLYEYVRQTADGIQKSRRRYTALQALAEHIKAYTPRGIRLQEVDKDYLLGFLNHLQTVRQKHCRQEKRLHPNTVCYYFKQLCQCLSRAVTDGFLSENPTERIKKEEKPKRDHSEREFLTINELIRLAHTPFYNRLLAKAFLFSCFCGLRHSDIRQLKWKNISFDANGDATLSLVQRKTRTPLTLPLSREAVKQLPERANATEESPVFDGLISLGRTNEILHRWAEAAGIGKHITFHTARHTHATMLLTLGVELYTVSKLLGHSSIQTTQIYAKLVDECKKKAVELIPAIT